MMISSISNSFSTGNGGGNFEKNIQALFLLTLLIDGLCPIINEPTKRVCFQAKHLGYDVDDLVVITDRQQSEGKLLCQIKHEITVTENSETFQNVITAAWSDFNKELFDKKKDKIILATARTAVKHQTALRFLYEHAQNSVDEKDFLDQVKKVRFSSDSNREDLNIIKRCISIANEGVEPTDRELWEFCKVFVLVLFDLDYQESINRTLAANLIKANCKMDPVLVWARLVEYAGWCNQNAGSIDIENIDPDIITFFSNEEVFLAPPEPLEEVDLFMPVLSLIGAWREDNSFDRSVIEEISGLRYEEFEAKARGMLIQNPDYLSLFNGTTWKVLHKKELFEQCEELFFDDIIDRLFESAKGIFQQQDKRLESETPFFIPSSGTHDNSYEIRNGIADSLCRIKCNISALKHCEQNKIKNHIVLFVREVLHDCPSTRWASLKSNLQNIAELSPSTFLQEVEWNAIHNSAQILKLFPKQGADLFGHENNISELLWALEILAWSPDYLIHCVRCLAIIEALPYEKTNWSNTPINSIVSILLPWHPQTLANSEKQINALKAIKTDNPEVFWNVVIRLFPNQTSSTINNPRPKYIPVCIPEEIDVSRESMLKQYRAIMSLAVDYARTDSQKIADLINEFLYMDTETMSVILDVLDGLDFSGDEEIGFKVWSNLCDSVARKDLSEAPSIYENLDRIHSVISKIEPRDIRLKYRRLYLGRFIMPDDNDHIQRWKISEQNKEDAIHEIFMKYGVRDTEAFGRAVNCLEDVGYKCGAKLSSEMMSMAIDSYHDGDISKSFAAACLKGFCHVSGAEMLLATTLDHYDSSDIADVLSLIPFTDALYGVINKLLRDEELYWVKASFKAAYDETDASILPLVLEKLTKCKRYIKAVNIIGWSRFEKVIDANDLYDLLITAGTEKSVGSEIIDDYAAQRIIGWMQKEEAIDIEQMSNIEFIYLPILDDRSDIQPKALYTRLSQDADYFCDMIEMYYKKHSETDRASNISEELGKRLFQVLFQFRVVPGIDWEGKFNESQFNEWMSAVKDWSKSNDRYAVTMETVGSGLSYSYLDDSGLPHHAIMEELEKPENDELRRGYLIGMSNQRGVHFVDSLGKEELELSEKFSDMADKAEQLGYSRYSGVLRQLANQYEREAAENAKIYTDRT